MWIMSRVVRLLRCSSRNQHVYLALVLGGGRVDVDAELLNHVLASLDPALGKPLAELVSSVMRPL